MRCSQRATLAPIHLANAAARLLLSSQARCKEKRPHPAPHHSRPYAATHLNYNDLNVALSSLFNTLPMSVFGRLSRNSINLGTLYGVNSFLQYAIISSRVSSDASKPGFNTMTAATVSPRYS